MLNIHGTFIYIEDVCPHNGKVFATAPGYSYGVWTTIDDLSERGWEAVYAERNIER